MNGSFCINSFPLSFRQATLLENFILDFSVKVLTADCATLEKIEVILLDHFFDMFGVDSVFFRAEEEGVGFFVLVVVFAAILVAFEIGSVCHSLIDRLVALATEPGYLVKA